MKFSMASLVPLLKRCKIFVFMLVGLCFLGSCVFFGWRHYQFKNSPQKALQEITQALQKGNRATLAMLVDFRTLSEAFSHQIIQEYPANSDIPSVEILAENMQQNIFAGIGKVEDPPKGAKPNPYAPLAPLPADAMAQIATSLEMQQTDEQFALARAKVEYPRAEKTFILIFQLEKSAGRGWQLKKIANASELIQAFMLSQQSIEQQKADALAAKNAEQQKRMNAQMVVNSCTAVAGMLSDRKTALLSIEILAHNPGPHAVLNFNVETQLASKQHPAEQHRFLLNLAKRTLQGENFSHTWNIGLDLQNPEHLYLLEEKKLDCTARFNNMGLSSGEVLFLRKNLQ